jgi:hypothetical protein
LASTGFFGTGLAEPARRTINGLGFTRPLASFNCISSGSLATRQYTPRPPRTQIRFVYEFLGIAQAAGTPAAESQQPLVMDQEQAIQVHGDPRASASLKEQPARRAAV